MKYLIYTDGSASPNTATRKVGWAAIIRDENKNLTCLGSFDADSTIIRAEIMGVICALESLKNPCEVLLFSDSMLTVEGAIDAKKRVGNMDLWERLDHAAAPHKIHWRWVKAHNNKGLNELADEIAKFHYREQKLHERVSQ